MTTTLTLQKGVTLNSICNVCNVFFLFWLKKKSWLTTQVASCNFPNFGRMNGLEIELLFTFVFFKLIFFKQSNCKLKEI